MKRILATALALVLAFLLCPAAFADEIHPDGLPSVYPLSIDEKAVANAAPAPKECFTSYASENGLEGTVCYLIGKVVQMEDVPTDQGTVHSFVMQTEYGYASVHDTYAFMMETYAKSETEAFVEPESDYSFPAIGDFVKVVGIYSGYSNVLQKPTFHYGTPTVLLAAYKTEAVSAPAPEPTLAPTPAPTLTPRPALWPGTSSGTSATKGEIHALNKALKYLEIMPFSYKGLIEQLEYEQFSHEEAVFAADNCHADWNERATKKAEKYLELMSFSRGGLIEQLEYDGFTHSQAVYGVEANGY